MYERESQYGENNSRVFFHKLLYYFKETILFQLIPLFSFVELKEGLIPLSGS